ncbi:MAG: 50S ribosomal protein L15 [Candidatus Daviesbacteria bacterium]|nr:MAG: 50S ribosomal protein L15 [Candidatus Daviesbacteria bacterium]
MINLPKVKQKNKKRIGRGIGSGKGKTAARGSKGQKARGAVPATFVGGGLPLYRKLPLRRGKGNPQKKDKVLAIPLEKLLNFKSKSTVDVEALVKTGIIPQKSSERSIKILGTADLKNPLTVKLPTSQSAKEAIKKAGGEVING